MSASASVVSFGFSTFSPRRTTNLSIFTEVFRNFVKKFFKVFSEFQKLSCLWGLLLLFVKCIICFLIIKSDSDYPPT